MTTDDQALEQIARQLYPDSAYLQQQWLRSVRLVRTTARGWCLDPPVLPAVEQRLEPGCARAES
jgi:hypothetical protein